MTYVTIQYIFVKITENFTAFTQNTQKKSELHYMFKEDYSDAKQNECTMTANKTPNKI